MTLQHERRAMNAASVTFSRDNGRWAPGVKRTPLAAGAVREASQAWYSGSLEFSKAEAGSSETVLPKRRGSCFSEGGSISSRRERRRLSGHLILRRQ